jgi:hypothetical protein
MTRRCLLLLYQALLALYPRSYRLTFSAEMVEVFRKRWTTTRPFGASSCWSCSTCPGPR